MQGADYRLAARGITLRSSEVEVNAALRAVGVLHGGQDYAKDLEFKLYVLPLALHNMNDVTRFIKQLEAESQGAECAKAYVARRWLTKAQSVSVPELEWALIGLARARRTGCSCHETGSFKRAPAHGFTKKSS